MEYQAPRERFRSIISTTKCERLASKIQECTVDLGGSLSWMLLPGGSSHPRGTEGTSLPAEPAMDTIPFSLLNHPIALPFRHTAIFSLSLYLHRMQIAVTKPVRERVF